MNHQTTVLDIDCKCRKKMDFLCLLKFGLWSFTCTHFRTVLYVVIRGIREIQQKRGHRGEGAHRGGEEGGVADVFWGTVYSQTRAETNIISPAFREPWFSANMAKLHIFRQYGEITHFRHIREKILFRENMLTYIFAPYPSHSNTLFPTDPPPPHCQVFVMHFNREGNLCSRGVGGGGGGGEGKGEEREEDNRNNRSVQL